MQANDFPRFQAVMTGMAELYQRELSAPLLDAYWLSLASWDFADFEAASGQLMRTSTFMPRPADFTALRKAGRPTAGEAWTVALKYARTGYDFWEGGGVSLNKIPPPDDALINKAVAAIGGYRAIALCEVDKTIFLEKRFCEHYESIQDAEEIREAVPQIAAEGAKRERINGPSSAANIIGRIGREQ